jgi:hypothetical protein
VHFCNLRALWQKDSSGLTWSWHNPAHGPQTSKISSNSPWHAKVHAKCCLVLTNEDWCCSFKVVAAAQHKGSHVDLTLLHTIKWRLHCIVRPYLWQGLHLLWPGEVLHLHLICTGANELSISAFILYTWLEFILMRTKYPCCGPKHSKHDIECTQAKFLG